MEEIHSLVKRESCKVGNDFDGLNWSARISSVFVILIASGFGSFFALFSSRYSIIKMPWWCLFFTKYFGSGVIIATAFIHLLEPANDALHEECLGPPFTEYPWAFGITLMSLLVMFLIELISNGYIKTKTQDLNGHQHHQQHHSHFGQTETFIKKDVSNDEITNESAIKMNKTSNKINNSNVDDNTVKDNSDNIIDIERNSDNYGEYFYGQLISVFILEFGIVFHSVLIGLSLAVSGDEFMSLYIVIIFHQLFEGLGLGARIVTIDWPDSKRATPWLLAAAYALCTPIAIAVGLAIRNVYLSGSRTALIVSGIFDSISAGILIFTGAVELIAYEFLYGDEFKGPGGFKKSMIAYIILCLGAGLMALLGKWA